MQAKHEKEPKNMLRMVSLLLALLMWVNFSGRVDMAQTTRKRIFSQVPLTYAEQPDHISIPDGSSHLLNITLTGPEKELELVSISDITASLNLSDRQEGVHTFPLTADNIHLSGRFKKLTVVDVIPDRLNLTLEHTTRKLLRLMLLSTGQPDPDYKVIDEVVTPAYVTIEGPTDRVRDLNYLMSQEVNLNGATEDVTGQFKLGQELPRGAFIDFQLKELTFRIQLAEKEKTVSFPAPYQLELEVEPGEETQWKDWSADGKEVSLVVSGPISVVAWFQPEWVVPTVRMATADAVFPSVFPSFNSQIASFEVTHRWRLPAEVQAELPTWSERVSRLELSWTPEQVEVLNP